MSLSGTKDCFLCDAPKSAPIVGAFYWIKLHEVGQPASHKTLHSTVFRMSLAMFGLEFGAAEGTRTPDPIITNDVLYQLSYSGLVTRRITASFETV